MLHTLNKAWATILAQRVNQRIMFVYTTPQEFQMLTDVFNVVEKENGGLPLMWVIHADDVAGFMRYGIDIEMCDDILISHNIHDMMLLDYLNRHCKRKCC